jgi:hypothetical protein
MTKKLEEEFNLPTLKEAIEINQDENAEVEITSEALTVEREEIFTALKAADKIDLALPTVRGLETNDVDMDSYSNQAEQAFKDLMDLGMNVEARHAGDIFAAAQRMLKNAIEAKTSKTDKKLKMIELQLKKLKLDQDKKTPDDTIEGEGYVIADRNDILKSFIDKENDK